MDVATRSGLENGYYAVTARVSLNYRGPPRAGASVECSIRQTYDGFLDAYDSASTSLSASGDVLVAGGGVVGRVIGYVAGQPNDTLSLTDVIGVSGDGTVKLTCQRFYGADGDSMRSSSASLTLVRVSSSG